MTASVPLNLNNSIISVAEAARGLVHTDDNGLAILSGFNYGSSLDYTPFGFTETFPRIDNLEHGAATQTATTALFKSVHLVAGTQVTVKGLFVAGDAAGHNDFGFMLVGQTTADAIAYLLADRNSVLANNGDWGFSYTISINVTGNYNIVFGAADAVNHNDPSELLIQSITLDIPIVSTSPTLDALILSDNSQLLANGSLVLPNGVVQANFLSGGGDGILASLITQDGAGIISHDGGGIISHDGGGVVSNDGAGLITNDGGGVVSNDGAGLITNDGGGLITNDGAGAIGPGASFAAPTGFVPTLNAYKASDSTPADSPDSSPAPTNAPGNSATGTSTARTQFSPPNPVDPVSVTLNKEPADLAVGATPRALLTVDVNHDGRPDIVTADTGGNSVTVLLSNGDGTFNTFAPITVAGSPAKLEAADLNGDHQLDLVAIDYDGDSATVLLGAGDGTFAAQAPMAVGHNPYDGTIVDLDGDGKLDLVVANSGAFSISFLKGNGDGTFQAQTQISRSTSPGYVAAADLDGDGRIDLVTTDYNDGTVTVLLQQSGGGFAAQAPLAVHANPVPVVLADVNRDGKLDMVVGNNQDNSVSILLGNGDGTFNAQTRLAVGGGPVSVAVGDLNGDGTQDIVSANSGSNSVTVLLGRGDGTFVTQTAVATGATPYYVSIADENTDGKPDVVVANHGGNSVSVLLNDSVLGSQSTFKDAFGNTVTDNADVLGRLTRETVTGPGGDVLSTLTLLYASDGTYRTHLEAKTTAGMVVSDVAYGLRGEIDTTVFINGQVNSTNIVTFNNDGSYARESTLAGVDGHDDLVYAADGTFVSHTHTDGMGNVTTITGPGTVDTTAPTLVITGVTGASDATSHLISGTIDVADSDAAVTVRDGLDVLGVAIPDGSGNWSLPFGVAAGAVHEYHLVASARDLAGNTGVSDTTILSADVDNQAPAVSGVVTLAAIAQDSGIRLIKQAELLGNVTDSDTDIGSLTAIHLTIANGAGSLIDNHNGTWSYTPAAGDGSSVSFSYQVTDGPSTVTDSATLDIVPSSTPPAPTPTFTGTPNDDSYTVQHGSERIDAGGGADTITFDFRLTDASIAFTGNEVIVDSATSHTVLTGFEKYVFTDGTVNNNDGDILVDDLFYYSQNHDVWNAHADADAHYHQSGWHEGRDPNAFFSTSTYLSERPDVKAAGVDPLVQFDQTGWRQGTDPSIAFDITKYFAANPDVKAANTDPLSHFLQYGDQEGRQPIAPDHLLAHNGFDYVYYLQHNPDVAAAHVDPLQHFETTGWTEGRNPNALFDTNGYLAAYADVKAAGVNPLDHYDQSGWKEGRDPSPGFDTKAYLAAYTDVAAAHIDPLMHYLQFGQAEGRSAFADGHFG